MTGSAAARAAAALGAALLVIAAAQAQAAPVEADGRLALRGLFSTDGQAATDDVAIVFLETDAEARNVLDGGLRLVLDATFVLDATAAQERRFGRTESLGQVRQLFVEQPELFGVLDVAVGRRIIAEAGNAWVDGFDLELSLGQSATMGLFGGLAPEPLDYAPTADRQAGGLYLTWRDDRVDAAAAYSVELRTSISEDDARVVGADESPELVDRQSGFGRVHLRLTDELFVATYVLADFATEPRITTLLGSVDYTPTPPVNLILNVSRYSLAQYRNEVIYQNVIEPNQALILGDEVIDLIYDRVRLSGSLTFADRYYHYQSLEYKRRSQDGLDAWHYTIGLRNDDVFGVGTRLDVHTQFRNNFQSDSLLISTNVQHDFGTSVTVDARFTVFDGKSVDNERARAFDEAQRVLLMGATVFWRISRQHQLDLTYDGIYETELQDQRNQGNLFIHTTMGRYSFMF